MEIDFFDPSAWKPKNNSKIKYFCESCRWDNPKKFNTPDTIYVKRGVGPKTYYNKHWITLVCEDCFHKFERECNSDGYFLELRRQRSVQ